MSAKLYRISTQGLETSEQTSVLHSRDQSDKASKIEPGKGSGTLLVRLYKDIPKILGHMQLSAHKAMGFIPQALEIDFDDRH